MVPLTLMAGPPIKLRSRPVKNSAISAWADQSAGQSAALLLAARQCQQFAGQHRGQLLHVGGAVDGAVHSGLGFAQQPQRRDDAVVNACRRVVDEPLADQRHLAVLYPLAGDFGPALEDAASGRRLKADHEGV